MKAKLLAFFLMVICAHQCNAGWTPLITGINSDLNGVVIVDSTGVVSSREGLFYTHNAYGGPSAWHRLVLSGHTADSVIVSHTRFNHCFMTTNTRVVYACGEDTVARKAVILTLNIDTPAYTLPYIGPAGSALNHIAYNAYFGEYEAVGNNGLVVSLDGTAVTVLNAHITSDLISVSFEYSRFGIVSRDSLYIGDYNNVLVPPTLVSQPLTPFGAAFRDVCLTDALHGFAIGNKEIGWSQTTARELTEYDYGPLNGRCAYAHAYRLYVGTDHGIFVSDAGMTDLEYQPSSQQYRINSIWAKDNTQMYACGDSGTLLVLRGVGESKPVVNIHMTGGCANTTQVLNASVGTSTLCQWFINDSLTAYRCQNVVFNFRNPGLDTIRLIALNDSLYGDTSIQIIQIVPVPSVTLPHTLSRPFICHSEPEVITIDSSQSGVRYVMARYGTVQTYGEVTGTGGTVLLTSDTISTPGGYYLQASSTVVQCSARFRDTLKIGVEKTQADFHESFINARPGEVTTFYQHCIDAGHYQWSFSPLPSAQSGAYDSVATVTYTAPGTVQATLICYSDHGCYDTLTRSSTQYVIENGQPDDCWQLPVSGPDLPWNGQGMADIISTSPCRDSGFVVCGVYSNERFSSYYGSSSVPVRPAQGGYCARYTSRGSLRWMVYDDNIFTARTASISGAVEDHDGNIYISGYGTYLKDNKGDSIVLLRNYQVGFVAKLDSNGKVLWRLSIGDNYSAGFGRIYIDNDNNLMVGMDEPYPTIHKAVYLNGVVVDSLHTHGQIVKIDPNGQILWAIGLKIDGTNYGGGGEPRFDSAGNIYMAGYYEFGVTFYSAGDTTGSYMPGHRDYGSSGFMARFDKNGLLQWKTRTITIGDTITANVIMEMATDRHGNMYLTGNNDVRPGRVQVIESTDGTIKTTTGGPFYVAKIDNRGVCQWLQTVRGGATVTAEAGLWQSGNEVSVLGHLSLLAHDTTYAFTSHDGYDLAPDFTPFLHFLVSYDTEGNVRRLIGDGYNQGATLPSGGGNDLFKLGSSYYYHELYTFNQGSYSNFGMPIPSSNGSDGLITKFSSGCGLLYYTHSSNITDYVCPGAPYWFHGHLLTHTGSYTDTLAGAAAGGLDSIVRLTLIMSSVLSRHLYDSACAGAAYIFRGRTVTVPGVYTDTLTATAGCDSVVVLHLTSRHVPTVTWAQTDTAVIIFCGQLLPPPGIRHAVPAGGHYTGTYVAGDSIFPSGTAGFALPMRDSVFDITYTYTDGAGCTSSLSKRFLLLYECEGVATISGTSATLHLYPDPNKGMFTLEAENATDAHYDIYDVMGHQVAHGYMVSDRQAISMPGVTSGVYMLVYRSESGTGAIRFAVE
ncbi:MAG: T9SS type A sorting domain-containing protein [Bacteroidetes bacterium]|nr:T9SS type A sorting domain-containing protein [Bacteroidota bacterium]